ncbi:MAG: MFS transporter, partial [Chloroflexi bacterium]|nr:MFS transporter [Chloroflexota bacterium]
ISNYAFSFYIEPLQVEFGWTRTQINGALSMWALGSLTAPFLGRFMDKNGSRQVIVFSLLLMALSFLLRPLMTELWHWYGLSVMQFICFSGAALLPAGRLVGVWFPKTRGRVMGLTMMGNNFGGLVMPPIVSLLLLVGSWQSSYLILGIVTVGLAVFSFFAIREPEVAKDDSRYGTSTSVLTGWTMRQVLRNRAFYVVTLVIVLGNFIYSMVLSQVFVHLTTEGISKGVAAAALSVLAACGMAGKLVFGYITERVPTRFVMMLSFSGQIVGMLLFLNPANPIMMWVGVSLFGFCMGAFGALGPLLVQESFGIKYFGSIMGSISLAMAVSFALGPIIAGLSFDHTGQYHIALYTMIAMLGLGIVLLTQARVRPFGES